MSSSEVPRGRGPPPRPWRWEAGRTVRHCGLPAALQDRLDRQQRDMEEERSRFQEVMGKMEARLNEQSRLLEQVGPVSPQHPGWVTRTRTPPPPPQDWPLKCHLPLPASASPFPASRSALTCRS